MSRSYYFIVLLAVSLLTVVFTHQNRKLNIPKKRNKTPTFLYQKYIGIKKSTESIKISKRSSGLYYALMTGDKRYLGKDTRKTFEKLGLMHLLTPSGLHLSSIVIGIKFLPHRIKLIFMLCIGIVFFLLDNYFAIKRVIMFKIFHLIIPDNNSNIESNVQNTPNKNQKAFLLTFVLDIILGNFQEGPLSYTYSFLFWGTILFHSGNIFMLSYKLFINLSITCVISGQIVSAVSLIINTPISMVFSFLYPFLFLNFWLPVFSIQNEIAITMIDNFYKTIFILSELLPTFVPSVLFVILLLLVPYQFKLRPFIISIILLFLTGANPVNKQTRFSNKKYFWSLGQGNNCKIVPRHFYNEIKCKKGS